MSEQSSAGWKVRGGVGINFKPSSNQHEASFEGHLWIEGQRALPTESHFRVKCAPKRASKNPEALCGILFVSEAAGVAF